MARRLRPGAGVATLAAVRVLILTPTAAPDLTGNATTVERLRRGLAARGDEVSVLATEPIGREGPDAAAIARAVRDLRPDVLHAYHAWRCGRFLVDAGVAAAAREAGAALVISLPGTDVERDLADPGRRPAILEACRRAGALVVHSEATRDRLREAAPDLAARARLCPKAVRLGAGAYDLRRAAGAAGDDVLFFLPAGIRPIKGNLFPIAPLAALAAERGGGVRLALAGPVLDAAYGREVRAAVDASGGVARHVPEIPLDAMGAAYAATDVVLNTSGIEGLANTILEAALAARAVLASDIPGNRAVVSPDETGLLYRPGDPADLLEKARALAGDPALRGRLGAAARERVRRERPPAAEVEALRAAYREAIGRPRSGSGPAR